MHVTKYVAAGVAAAVISSHAALAGVILQPTGISSPQGSNPLGAISLIIDQSGLSANYVSGVTDFDSFTAGTTHTASGANSAEGFTNSTELPQQFTFDLGAALTISSMALWNASNPGAVTAFELFVDDDGDFGNGTGASLGSFSASSLSDPNPAQLYSFGAVTTQFVHLNATAPGPGLFIGLGEVAFESADMPEPGTLGLLGLGLAAFGCYRRRATA